MTRKTYDCAWNLRQTFGEGDVNRAKVNLMYVGLYPSELIEALNKLDQVEQPGQPRELNFPVWMGTTIAVTSLAWLLSKTIDRNRWGQTRLILNFRY
ncbi:MAG: hypothetical protein P8X79_23190 [Reinekea sp.]